MSSITLRKITGLLSSAARRKDVGVIMSKIIVKIKEEETGIYQKLGTIPEDYLLVYAFALLLHILQIEGLSSGRMNICLEPIRYHILPLMLVQRTANQLVYFTFTYKMIWRNMLRHSQNLVQRRLR